MSGWQSDGRLLDDHSAPCFKFKLTINEVKRKGPLKRVNRDLWIDAVDMIGNDEAVDVLILNVQGRCKQGSRAEAHIVIHRHQYI